MSTAVTKNLVTKNLVICSLAESCEHRTCYHSRPHKADACTDVFGCTYTQNSLCELIVSDWEE